MLDFGEIILIGLVALVVLGPERLPQAARTLGQWVGRMQHYVSQVKTDFDREFHLADLRALGEEARAGADTLQSAVHHAVVDINSEAARLRSELMTPLEQAGWSSGPPSPPATVFRRRYRPRPTIDDLSLEIERLKRQLALPETVSGSRRRWAPRARVNRVRVRR